MDQQALNAVETADQPSCSERREPPPPALIPGWRCVRQAEFRAQGDTGFVDLAALHPRRGVALVALLEADEEASPEEARAAFRAMLGEAAFEEHFPGDLPVVALALRRADADQLAASVERAFASLTPPSLAEEWVEWLAERLSPAASVPEPSPPQLVAPSRDDALPERTEDAPVLAPLRDETPPAEAAPPILAVVEAPPQVATLPGAAWLDWGGSFGFAVGIVLALLFGLLLLSQHGHVF